MSQLVSYEENVMKFDRPNNLYSAVLSCMPRILRILRSYALAGIALFGFAPLAHYKSQALALSDTTPPALVVTGPFAANGSTPLTTANRSSTIVYKLSFSGADTIASDSDLAAKITLSQSGVTGSIAVSGSGLQANERRVTLTNVDGDGAIKIIIDSGTASDLAGNRSLTNVTSKTFLLDNIAPTSTSISINKAAVYTNSTAAQLTMAATGAAQMYVTNTAGCASGSVYESYSASKPWVLASTNATATVYVKFKDLAGNESACINDDITHDNTAPTFVVSGPSQANARKDSVVTYSVTYSGAGSITLAAQHITVNTTGGAAATATVYSDPLNASKRIVSLSNFKNNGTIGIAIKSASAMDLIGNIAAAGTNSATVNVETGNPSITVGAPSLDWAKADSVVTYTVTYSGVTGVTLANSNITLEKTDTANATYAVSGTGSTGTVTRTVTLSGFTGNGAINIAIAAGTATNSVGNLAPALSKIKKFSVDTTTPAAPMVPTSKTFNRAFDALLAKATGADSTFKELRYVKELGGSAIAPADCASGTMLLSGKKIPISVPATSVATTSLAVISCDKAGNKSAASTATYTYDDVAPTVSISAPSLMVASPATPEVSFTVTYTGADIIDLSPSKITRLNTESAWAGLSPVVSMDHTDPNKRIVTLKKFRATGTLGISIAAGTGSDYAGNKVRTPTVSPTFFVTNPAAITAVSLDLPSGAGASKAGTLLSFTVTTSTPVTVTGAPTLPFKIGAIARAATYASGSGTTSLVFTYTTGVGDNGLVTWAAGSLVDGASASILTSPVAHSGTTIDVEMNRVISSGKTSRMIDTTPPTSTTIAIYAGAASTSSRSTSVMLSASGASAIYITNTAGCTEGGAYENYATSKLWILGETFGTATVYVKFKDEAGNESSCINDTINVVTAYPAPATASISVGALDSDSGKYWATLTWSSTTSVSNFQFYHVEFKVNSPSATWTRAIGRDGIPFFYESGKSHTVGLMQGTPYIFRVKSIYGYNQNGISDWTETTVTGPCEANSIEPGCAAESALFLSLTGRRPLAIKSGNTVSLTGTGFNKGMLATIGGVPVTSMSVTSATSASVVVPSSGIATGMVVLRLGINSAEATASMAYSPTDAIPLMTLPASEVCAGVDFYDHDGDRQVGSKNCPRDLSLLIPGNIRSGVTIAGVTGEFPSDTYRLTGSLGTADLDEETFDAKVKSATQFEWFSPNGVRHTGVGDADLKIAANIFPGLTIFGTTGTLESITPPQAWDLRAGVTVGGVAGMLKVNCRNAVKFSGDYAYNYTRSGAVNTSVGEVWDTTADVGGLPSNVHFPPAWPVTQHYCGNNDPNAPSENDVWVDATTKLESDGITRSASTCAATPTNCTMKDRISGLKWSKLQSTNASWAGGAIPVCNSLTHNGQLAGSWRLPTQKELLEFYNHGGVSAVSANWITIANMGSSEFWSATTDSTNSGKAWLVRMHWGTSLTELKGNGRQVVCVQ